MVSPLIYAHLLRLDELEEMVARLKQEYMRAADRKRHDPLSAYRAWVPYAHLLHALRLHKRRMK